MRRKSIVILDGDRTHTYQLQQYLVNAGFDVISLSSVQELNQCLPVLLPDLIIMELKSPEYDGFSLCRQLYQQHRIPLMLMSEPVDEAEWIVALEVGAEAFLVKPFNPRMLLAKVRVLLRRRQPVAVVKASPPDAPRRYRFGSWVLDHVKREIEDRDGKRTPLSGADFQLLKIFLTHANQVLSRDQLYGMTRGRDSTPDDRSLDVHISRLRHRLEDDAKNPSLIKTIRGVGYVLSAHVEPLAL
ncbi:winged helix-turn-helix domain-containing protein [Photobacterium sp. GJ3]|uniref:winged helix-turn-helix domain-containing protein n=1 Tax=Photobacterium sp. GJ3 TaxID=2829502 RepID=UPI001B8B2D4E|nr:winged helix-turn-helix domain-containing protein [Photobacterium sp. GJ3]QUJ67555.1 winged helix-turn-helix domain-containing protein [Photobacterium sp. GJ3]